MTSLSDVDSLADRLFTARHTVGSVVDLAPYALNRSDGLALQLRVADRFAERGDEVGGWKVAYTSGAQRDRMGDGYRAFGFVPASRVLRSGASVPLSAFRKPAIEVELCLRVDEHGNAVAVAPAFELIDKRIVPDADDATVVADGCSNWGIVVGTFLPIPDVRLTTLAAGLSRAGVVVDTCRPGDTMDDPMLSLERLKERLAEYGRSVSAGASVITGSITKAAVDGPGPWTGEIDGLGTVELTFT
jgi:2-keto-4-pentenoate hydratase